MYFVACLRSLLVASFWVSDNEAEFLSLEKSRNMQTGDADLIKTASQHWVLSQIRTQHPKIRMLGSDNFEFQFATFSDGTKFSWVDFYTISPGPSYLQTPVAMTVITKPKVCGLWWFMTGSSRAGFECGQWCVELNVWKVGFCKFRRIGALLWCHLLSNHLDTSIFFGPLIPQQIWSNDRDLQNAIL